MKRELYKSLIEWKKSKIRKPLLLQGARQVGKTYLINEFGKKEYSQLITLNFEREPKLKSLFENGFNSEKIISNIGLYYGKKVTSDNTLIFFDEIQASQEALTSLKYFNEEKPELHIIAAGSLLGVSIGKDAGFPVGQVDFLSLYPLSFSEYLAAIEKENLFDELLEIENIKALPQLIHEDLLRHLKMYLFLGGMPEVVKNYIKSKDIKLVRKTQENILKAYQRDFSKYTTKTEAIRISEFWNSIPGQLSKENKKFKYKDIRANARSSMYEQTVEWLKNAGLITQVYNLKKPKLPLSGYSDLTKFKIYLLDTGLLGALLKLTSDIIIDGSKLFSEYNGAFIENFVANQLINNGKRELYYWTSKSDAEVDFIIQIKNEIYPVEVKSGTSKNLKSLQSYSNKFAPNFIIRSSPRNFIKSDKFINIPLYAISIVENLIEAQEIK